MKALRKFVAVALSSTLLLTPVYGVEQENSYTEIGDTITSDNSSNTLGDSNIGFVLEGQEATMDPISSFIQKLDPDTYGGVYVKDEALHISSPQPQILSKQISKMREELPIALSFEKADYSYSQLTKAQKKLDDKMEELNIVEHYLDDKNQIVIISPDKWNEERKQEMYSLLGIKNIEFITNAPEYRELASVGDAVYGTRQTSLTCGIKDMDGKAGFLTCGHGYTTDQEVFYNGSKMGYVYVRGEEGKYDFSCIRKDGLLSPSNSVKLPGGESIDFYGNPLLNNTVTMYGAISGSISGVVVGVNATSSYNGKKHTNYIKIKGANQKGDSGGGVIDRRNGNKTLIGAAVSTDGTYTFCTNIVYVVTDFNVTIMK